MTEAQFKELVVGVQSWLQLCKKAFDPDNRVIRSISVVPQGRPDLPQSITLPLYWLPSFCLNTSLSWVCGFLGIPGLAT